MNMEKTNKHKHGKRNIKNKHNTININQDTLSNGHRHDITKINVNVNVNININMEKINEPKHTRT